MAVTLPAWLRQSVALAPGPWAVTPALRAMAAAGAIAIVGVNTNQLSAVALMYFGAACAVTFVATGSLRTRLVALAAQGSGAAFGLGFGAIATSSDVGKVAVAAAVGMLSGMLGAIGRLVTAFALMAVIGVAFEQFGHIALPWYEQAGWYLAGTLVVSLAAILPSRKGRRVAEREAVAGLYDAIADLLAVSGTPEAAGRRQALAAASAASRAALQDHRIVLRHRGTALPRIRVQLRGAQLAALAAASLYSRSCDVSGDAIEAVRAAAADVRGGEAVRPRPFDSAGLDELAAALDAAAAEGLPISEALPAWGIRLKAATRVATEKAAVLAGLRLAWCMTLATTLTLVLHQKSHSYWLPLTVAVVVRPEYASVFVRTVNRVIGTIAGAVLAALALIVLPTGGAVAAAAALAIGWAVLASPRLYGLSVIGITASALLSASIGTEDPVYPALRLLDTLAGCGVAIIFGYLLWPGRRALPFAARPTQAASDAIAYLRLLCRPRSSPGLSAARDRAYLSVHQYRASVSAALADPPPASVLAAQALPAAIGLEDVVDAITALGSGDVIPEAEVETLAAEITALGTGDHGKPDEVLAHLGALVSG